MARRQYGRYGRKGLQLAPLLPPNASSAQARCPLMGPKSKRLTGVSSRRLAINAVKTGATARL